MDNILVAAHSKDADNRPLSTYEDVVEMRFLHILGAAIVTGEPSREDAILYGRRKEAEV